MIKRAAIIAASSLALLGGGVAIGTSASAGTTPTYSTSTTNKWVVSGRCIHEHRTTVTYYHWDSKAGGYVKYSSPHTTTSDSTSCHK